MIPTMLLTDQELVRALVLEVEAAVGQCRRERLRSLNVCVAGLEKHLQRLQLLLKRMDQIGVEK